MRMLMKFKMTLAVIMLSALFTSTLDAQNVVYCESNDKTEVETVDYVPSLTAGIGAVLENNISSDNKNTVNKEDVSTERVIADKYATLNQTLTPDVSIEKTDVVIVTASLDDIAVKEDTKTNQLNSVEEKEEDTKDLEVVDTDVKELKKTLYVNNQANVRVMPTTESEVLTKLNKGDDIKVTGETKKWYRIKYKDADAFISKDLCQATKPQESKPQETKASSKKDNSSIPTEWNGKRLTKQAGTVQGPSGKETYYNLNMSGVVSRLHRMGYSGEYWVRDDGVKMFGNYILVAASFDIRPIGTILPTSLGMGIVADTGGFARYNKYQLDIATTW